MEKGLEIKAWDPLLALEGLFIQVALNLQEQHASATWAWDDIKQHVLDIIGDLVERGEDLLPVLIKTAKDNSDHVRDLPPSLACALDTAMRRHAGPTSQELGRGQGETFDVQALPERMGHAHV